MNESSRNPFDDVFCLIHFDYYYPWFVELGKEFDKKSFAAGLKKTGAEAVVIYPRDEYGYGLYDSKVVKKHPGMKFNLLREQTDACRSAGVKVFYYIGGFDSAILECHPDWAYKATPEQAEREDLSAIETATKGAVNSKQEMNKTVKYSSRICLNSPNFEDFIKPMLIELSEQYSTDGFWFDMWAYQVYTSPCYCRYCEEKFRNDFGKDIPRDPTDPLWFKYMLWYAEVYRQFEKKSSEFARSILPGAAAFYNSSGSINRPIYPTFGDLMSYDCGDNPVVISVQARFMSSRTKTFTPMLSRFNQGLSSWMIHTPDNMKQLVSTCIANGGKAYIIDRLPPECRFYPGTVDYFKDVFKYAKERRPFIEGAEPIADVGMLSSCPTFNYKTMLSITDGADRNVQTMGASKALVESGISFVIFDEINLKEKLNGLKTLALCSERNLSGTTLETIAEFVHNGGGLVVTYDSGMFDEEDKPYKEPLLDKIMGIKRYISEAKKDTESEPAEYQRDAHFIIPEDKKLISETGEYPIAAHAGKLKIENTGKNKILANIVPPLFRKCPGIQGAPDFSKQEAGIILSSYGKGKVVYCASDFVEAYFHRRNPFLRYLMKYLVNLVTKDKIIEVDAPPCIEVTLFKQGKRLIVHMVNYATQRITQGKGPERHGRSTDVVDKIHPVHDIDVRLRVSGKVTRVMLQPEGQKLKFITKGNYILFRVPKVHIHSMAVVE